MKGLMQNQPLLLSSLLQHADRFHGSTEIVSRTVEGPIHRYTYADAGVYGFNTSAQLTGTLTLDGQGNPNSVFIFNIGSTLTLPALRAFC